MIRRTFSDVFCCIDYIRYNIVTKVNRYSFLSPSVCMTGGTWTIKNNLGKHSLYGFTIPTLFTHLYPAFSNRCQPCWLHVACQQWPLSEVLAVNTSACGASCFTCKDGAFACMHFAYHAKQLPSSYKRKNR